MTRIQKIILFIMAAAITVIWSGELSRFRKLEAAGTGCVPPQCANGPANAGENGRDCKLMKIKKRSTMGDQVLTEAAKFFGFGFFLLGAAGFVPFLIIDGMLFGVFKVSPALNFFHMVVGTAGLLASSTGQCTSRFLFQILTVTFGAFAGLDYLNSLNGILSDLAGNEASFMFHGVAALASACLGYSGAMKAWSGHRPATAAPAHRRHRRRPQPTAPHSEDLISSPAA